MHPRTILFAAALTCLAAPATAAMPLPAASLALEGVDGNRVLAEVDRRADPFEDQRYTATMKIVKGGQVKKTLTFDAVMQGFDKQLLEFTSPGDVAGMKVLMTDADTLYLYSKEFGKVRKVAAHAVKQGFMGGEFTYEDMTQLELSPRYDATLAGKAGDLTTLELRPKAGADASYPKLEVVIDGSKGGVTRIRYFDASGKQVREQQRERWVKVGKQLVPTQIKMLNLKTGDMTVIELANLTVNQGVDESTFTRRQLLRG